MEFGELVGGEDSGIDAAGGVFHESVIRDAGLFFSRTRRGWVEIIRIPSPDVPWRVTLSGMETITRQVNELRPNERSAAELLLGHRLRGHERLVLQVLESDAMPPIAQNSQTAQALPSWCNVYEGLSDEEVENIDRSITRCNLTRPVE